MNIIMRNLDIGDAMNNRKAVCPKCYKPLKEHNDKIICSNCGSEYNHGETVVLPLKQLVKMKNEENKLNKVKKPDPKEARILKRKKHSTGFYGVSRIKPRKGKPKGCWRYRSKVFGINILRVDLRELKEDVINMGGEWRVVNEEVAEKSRKINQRYAYDE